MGRLVRWSPLLGLLVVVALFPGWAVSQSGSSAFDDVPSGHYAEDAIGWAAAGGITTGVGNNLFGIGRTLTREQMVTFLCRAYNPPCATGTARGSDTFDDVPAGHWADASIGWAVAEGITTGVSATRFGVGQTLTREQMVTFLYRAEGSPAVTVVASPFGDVAVGDGVWYERPVVWAFSEEISGGVASGVFGLGTTLSRGEMVLFLCRANSPDVCAPSQVPIPTGVESGSVVNPVVSGCKTPDTVACDRQALVALYDAAGGPDWKNNDNWKTSKPLSEWDRVRTDREGRVTAISLGGDGLSGHIPEQLGDLTKLTRLHLFHNLLSGPIPKELGNLTNLTNLSLGNNRLSGNIPKELGNLANLTKLDLTDNNLSGPIPKELGHLANLTELYLQRNLFSGHIPKELGDLTNLRRFVLSNNLLSGPIPKELASIPKTTRFNLHDNLLSGPIPEELDDHRISRSGNLLFDRRRTNETDYAPVPTPCIAPDTVPCDRQALAALYDAAGVDFQPWNNWNTEAPLSEWAGVRTDKNGRVTILSLLDWVFLDGTIPGDLGSLTKLTQLRLPRHLLRGYIPRELGDLTNLTRLELHNNALSGSIPRELGNLTNLTVLRLESNRLSGSIPRELGKLTKLTTLNLGNGVGGYDNQFSGHIPRELGNLTNLTALKLEDNRLSGSIPRELGNLTNLTQLHLYDNLLSGPIPRELGNLTNLPVLDLSSNRLTGPIPKELGDLTSLTNLNLVHNRLSGSIPKEVGDLTNLTQLVLSRNGLSGSIPSQLGNLNNLNTLVLSNNRLSGNIPKELGNLTNLTTLNLEQNELSGPIPKELGNLTNLTHLFLQGNDLCVPPELSKSSLFTKFGYPGC